MYIITHFNGVVRGDKHLCLFLALAERRTSQECGIACLGELHQLADELFLFRRGRYIVQDFVLLGSVDTDVLSRAEIANLRIKVMGMNVIS